MSPEREVAAEAPDRGRRAWLPALGVVVGILVLVVWRSGPGKVPNVEGFEGIARFWPLYPVEPVQAYVLRQALGQALYRALGWEGTGHYLLLHLIALAVGAAVLAAWLLRRLGLQRGTIAICLLLVAPITVVLLEWVGMYDAFSVLVWVVLICTLRGNPVLQLAAGLLGGLQNFEQFTVSVVVLALLPELLRSHGLRLRLVPVAIGTVLGKVALELYLSSAGAVDGSRASFLENSDMQHLVLSTFALLAPVVVWSVLSGLWLPVSRVLVEAWPTWTRSLRVRTALAAAVVLGVGVIGADHTRVMTLVSFPVVVLICMTLARREEDVLTWVRRRETVLLLMIPVVVVYSGITLPLGLDLSTWGL